MRQRLALCIGLIILCAVIGTVIENMRTDRIPVNDKTDSTQLMLGMLGELRYTLAAFVWLKADFYHHEYDYSNKDWRSNEALMSLIRLVTILDPHFVQAYDFGGYHLAVNLGRPKEAIKFLDEAIRNNPDNFELNWEMGYVLTNQKKYREALGYLLQARALWTQKSHMDDVALKQIWVVSRIAHCYYELDEWKEARTYCKEWLKISPDAYWPQQKLKIIDEKLKDH
jgi:tetratricopeptide (TPR) repeat protein